MTASVLTSRPCGSALLERNPPSSGCDRKCVGGGCTEPKVGCRPGELFDVIGQPAACRPGNYP